MRIDVSNNAVSNLESTYSATGEYIINLLTIYIVSGLRVTFCNFSTPIIAVTRVTRFPSKAHVFDACETTRSFRSSAVGQESESIRKRRFNLSYFSTLVSERRREMVRDTREKLGARVCIYTHICVYTYILVRSIHEARVE